MKKFGEYFSSLVLIGLIVSSIYFIYQKTLDPCQRPLQYSIGRFDTQFGVTQEEFINYLSEAETVWEKALGRDVFAYDSEAKFKVNLVYDQRQLETTQKQKTEFGLSAVEDTFKKLDTDFNIFKNQYEQKVTAYEANLALYKKGKYSNDEVQILNQEAAELNKEAAQLNALLKERNNKAAEYNKMVEAYNQKYNQGVEFNQAEYIGNPMNNQTGDINVYQFGNKKDLILALTHEFGHALGMNHTENPNSVMYYLTRVNAGVSPTLSAEDLAELQRVCKK
ncbi:MAG: matrixin family metalloprotease [Candidatus Paceibacterota bacterium]|jgi:hypothetical protein